MMIKESKKRAKALLRLLSYNEMDESEMSAVVEFETEKLKPKIDAWKNKGLTPDVIEKRIRNWRLNYKIAIGAEEKLLAYVKEKNMKIEKMKIKLVGKPRKAVSILSSGNTQKDLEKIAEIKQEREQNKKRLLNLLYKYELIDHQAMSHPDYDSDKSLAACADFLIANGVTLPVRCKDCLYGDPCKEGFQCMHDHGLVELCNGNDFCSYGKVKE